MNNLLNWNDTVMLSLQNVWMRVISFLPELVAALIILIIGLIIAYTLSNLVYRLITYTRVDKLMARAKVLQDFKKGGFEIHVASIASQIVKWFFIIVTIIAASDTLRLSQLNNFLDSVLLYIPNVIVAILIIGFGLFLAQVIGDLIEKAAKISYPRAAATLSTVAHWAIVIFTLMAALVQLGIANSLIEILFTGLVAGAALAFGLAFGLGGKEKATELLNQINRVKPPQK